MIEPAEHSFVIYKGATFRKNISFVDESDQPKDLSGYTAALIIRPKVDSPTILLSLTTANGGIILGGVDGTIQLFIADTVTDTLTWHGAYYDLKVTAPSTDVDMLLYGKFSVHG